MKQKKLKISSTPLFVYRRDRLNKDSLPTTATVSDPTTTITATGTHIIFRKLV